ncbi:response regulator [Aerosakkonema funiforme]|uniref:hybrid sensor histidine kinase/response regulator n=1 Tax=Aerosakkonema funiforme TaxID=1246630 RepID=UPI0035BC1C27
MVENLVSSDILIVDDISDNIRLLSSMLVDSGYRVRKVVSGERALKAIALQVPDLILLDIRMPDMDGYEVCKRLKASDITKEIPIIFISAADDVFDKVKGFEVGGADYITKPFEPIEVLARVEQQLAIRRYQQELFAKNKQLAQHNIQLEREIKQRQQAERRLKVFVHTVSHDLRNPVTGISLFLQSYLSNSGENVVLDKPIVEMMLASCDRQLQLIDSLVETQKLEANNYPLNLQSISLYALTSSIIKTWFPMLNSSRVVLNNRILSELPYIHVDPEQLWRVFENLIGNALKYNSPGITLTLDAQVDAKTSMLRVTVADNGVGIPKAECDKLFELYVRGKDTKDRTGSGLGLYICRQIVEVHGGQIGVKSELGKGTQFWFTLPLSIAPTDIH